MLVLYPYQRLYLQTSLTNDTIDSYAFDVVVEVPLSKIQKIVHLKKVMEWNIQ